MIQLVINGEQISIHAADEIRIDPDMNGDGQARRSFIVSAIKRMLTTNNFRGKNVISCLPSGSLKITSLRLGETDKEETEQVLRREVVQRFNLDPDKDAMDYVVAGNVRQGDELKNELILFAADKETIEDHISMLEEAGLTPVGIDTIPGALFRSFERSLRRQEDKEGTLVFVDVGCLFTTVVFGRGGDISFVKQIAIGGDKFVREVAARLGISVHEARMLRESLWTEKRLSETNKTPGEPESPDRWEKLDASTRQIIVDAVTTVAEELTREISLCLRYYTVTFRGKRVERAVFAGGGAYEDILLGVLRRQLAVEVEVAQPLRGFDLSNERASINIDSDRRGLLCEWAVAVGLALKNCEKAKITSVI